MGRWDKQATKLLRGTDAGVVAACQARPVGGLSAGAGGGRVVGGAIGAAIGRRADERNRAAAQADVAGVDATLLELPPKALVVVTSEREVLVVDAGRKADPVVLHRRDLTSVVEATSRDIKALSEHVVRHTVTFRDGTGLIWDTPRQGFVKDLRRFAAALGAG